MDNLTESALSRPCKEWLIQKGCDVSAEVKDVDVLGIYNGEDGTQITIAVELKLRLNLELILQAVERQRVSDYVYMAIPHDYKLLKTSRFKRITHLLRRLNVGLLTVNFKSTAPYVSEIIEAKDFDFQKSQRQANRKKEAIISEFNSRKTDSNDGGITQRKIMTAYREQALYIAHCLKEETCLSIKALKEKGCGAKTSSILQANYYNWFERVSKGQYKLKQEGVHALSTYEDVLAKILEEAAK